VDIALNSKFRYQYYVDAPHIQIRHLTPADAALYREIRLEGLQRDPEAFGSTFEAESSKSVELFAKRLTTSTVFGAFDGSQIVGVAALVINQGPKEAHKGQLVGMYVRASARRSRVGQRLVEAIINHARNSVELVQLSVVSTNGPARRLYARLGFVEYGLEKNSLKQDGHYFDEILAAKDLRLD
jgi:ribosomal protein S18 acetylase RimI-like enzyme